MMKKVNINTRKKLFISMVKPKKNNLSEEISNLNALLPFIFKNGRKIKINVYAILTFERYFCIIARHHLEAF